ncbi:hypothetical protein J4Q44_G00231420 [Coregonus suidteri]|uniref:Uncharacterized protein n=1 Tax=Coregonus suidteri TaxID=861788 RepID=A0AAN8QYE4_9TELE
MEERRAQSQFSLPNTPDGKQVLPALTLVPVSSPTSRHPATLSWIPHSPPDLLTMSQPPSQPPHLISSSFP